jgi:hypothetical protein
MIGRVWHGYTKPEDANAYEEMLLTEILPGLHRVGGYKGAWLLRKDDEGEVEFITITLWESMEAVRQFAGPQSDVSVIAPEAEHLLSRHDDRSKHYKAIRSE